MIMLMMLAMVICQIFIWTQAFVTVRIISFMHLFSTSEIIMAHVASSGAFVLIGYFWVRKNHFVRQVFLVMGFCALLIPVVGSISVLLVYWQSLRHKNPKREDEEEMEFDYLDKEKMADFISESDSTSMTARIARDTDVLPLADIMTGTNTGLIRGAVERLAALNTPQAIAILLEHRSSAIAEVRFYVTTALTRLRGEYDEQINSAKQNLREQNYKVSARYFLARQYYNYALSGLLDATVAESYLNESLEHMRIVVASEFANRDHHWFMVDLLSAVGNNEEVMNYLARDALFPSTDSAERIRRRAEILLKSGKYGKIVPELSDLKNNYHVSQNSSAMFDWWGV